MIDALVGAAIAIIVIIMPLQMYYNSRGLMRTSTENEKAMQMTRMLMDEYRSMLSTAAPLCAGSKTLYYSRDGLYLGNNTHFISWTPAEKAPIYYTVSVDITSTCQNNLSLGASGNTADIDLKDLKIETKWFQQWNGSFNRANVNTAKTLHVKSIINGARDSCSALPECHCIANPDPKVNCL